MAQANYEQLGVFYLGKTVDDDGDRTDDLLLYDSKDLTTHALVVGMTGSGKTGLSVGLLEEAAIDGLPAIVIDPKGDLGNLLLTFPDLAPSDFEPWVDPAEATRAGKTPDEFAKFTSELWRTGLDKWQQDGDRIRRFRESTDLTIYTPGASAGMPLSVMKSFDAPAEAVREDADALRERVDGATSGLLALLGIEADPVRSREYILLANLLQRAWSEGKDLDLGALIQDIQKPPFERLGVIDLETFYPAKDRIKLALQLNGLLASPGFSAWLDGEPLDIQSLLYRPDGRPRISIISIAHLSDSERMFVVTLLLNEMVAWMRSQSGTSSLRALLYMDEIYGYFPPSKNPPSKTPMLTLLKQARAFGLGCVLATQNPVDLDYKGLSNCGSWFIGRLQTEQDKNRILDGLESAAGAAGSSVDRAELSRRLGSLGKRVFLLNNVHEDGPQIFNTRWVLSYLRGPLMRSQIATLMASKKKALTADGAVGTAGGAGPSAIAAATPQEVEQASDVRKGKRPVLGEGVEELFALVLEEPNDGERVLYRPRVLAQAQVHFKRTTLGVDLWQDVALVTEPEGSSISWDGAGIAIGEAGPTTRKRPMGGARYAELPAVAQRAQAYRKAATGLKAHLYREHRLCLFSYPAGKLNSEAGESESDFRLRVQQERAEQRDLAVEKLRTAFARKMTALEKRIDTAAERVDREKSQLRDRKLQTAISFGSSLLGAVMGRKKFSSSTRTGMATALRNVGRSRREGDDVSRANEKLEDLLEEKGALEAQFEVAADEVKDEFSGQQVELVEVEIPMLKTDLSVKTIALLWTPWAIDSDGIVRPLS